MLGLAVSRVTNETYYGCEISGAVTSVNLATVLWLSPTLPSKLLRTQETVTFPSPGKSKHRSWSHVGCFQRAGATPALILSDRIRAD